MKKALVIFPVILLLLAAAALASRWYEVEDEAGENKPKQKVEQKKEPAKEKKEEKKKEPANAEKEKTLKAVATWMYTYGGRGEDTCRTLARAEDGYVMAGYTGSFGGGHGDAWFVRTDADGKAVWDKTYGVSFKEDALGIATSDTGGWCVAGKDESDKFLALKLGEDGEVLWKKNFGGSLPANGTGVDAAPGGGCVVAGYFTRNPGNKCDGYGWMAELDSAGKEVWTWNDAPACTSWMRAVRGTPFGTHVAAGEKFDGGDFVRYWIFKLDKDRTIRWQLQNTARKYNVYSVKSLIATDDGAFVVSGGAKVGFDNSDYNGWMIKVDAAGNVVWEKYYNGQGDPDMINSVVQIEGGGFAAAGYKIMPNGRFDGSILETDPYGVIKWHKNYGGANNENFTGLAPAVEGDGYVVAGVTNSKGAGNYDFLIMKTDLRGICMGCKF